MIATGDFVDYKTTVPLLLDRLDIPWRAWDHKKIALKPNLVSYRPHPFTTSPELIRIVGEEIQKRCRDVNIYVMEGSPQSATQMYAKHGYLSLPYNLVDIDTRIAYYTSKIDDPVLPEVLLPVALQDSILVSCAVAKEHPECVFTGCAKNLVGLPPTQHYTHNGLWKDALHDIDINAVIKALNRHKSIALSVLDLSIGTRGCHVAGQECNPPIGKIIVGDCPYEVDREGCKLMGIDPAHVPYLN